jgi:hypothetical protein
MDRIRPIKKSELGLGFSLVVEHLPRICKALGSKSTTIVYKIEISINFIPFS